MNNSNFETLDHCSSISEKPKNMVGVLALLGLCSIATPAMATDLLELYSSALQNDPLFQGARYTHQAAVQGPRQSLANMLPQVTLDYEDVDTTQNIKSSDNAVFATGETDFPSQTLTLTLTQPLFNYSSWVRHRQAKVELSRSDAELEVASQDLILRVAELYTSSLAAEDALDFSKAEKISVKGQLDLAKGKLDSGLARKTDYHDAKARFASVEAVEIEAQNTLSDSLQALQEMTGEVPDNLVKVRKDMALVRPVPDAAAEWVDAALKQNPNILLLQQAVEVAREEVNRQKAGHYPTLDLVVRQNNRETKGTLFGGGSEVETQDVLLSLKVPLYQGGYVSSRSKEAAELYEKAKQDMVQQKRLVMREVRAAYLGVISAISMVEALQESVESYQLALKARQEGLKAGLYTAIAVLDAESDLYEAKRNYSRARYDYIMNTLRLKRSAGILAEADVVEINHLLE